VKRTFLLAWCVVSLGLAGFACTDNSGNGNGTGSAGTTGTGGSNAGTAGTGGTSAGGSGGTSAGGTGGTSAGGTGGTTPGFMSVLPCTSESQYVGGTPTVNFGFINGGLAYDPKCLKVPVGTTVTFSGDFGTHPLAPSANRGNQTNNPITVTSAGVDGGTTADFKFSTAGFYAYYCQVHDSGDTGNFMDGVIWVQ